jgi:hypothetical protein
MQGLFREHSRDIQGTCSEHVGNMQGTFEEHSGNVPQSQDFFADELAADNFLRPLLSQLLGNIRSHAGAAGCGKKSKKGKLLVAVAPEEEQYNLPQLVKKTTLLQKYLLNKYNLDLVCDTKYDLEYTHIHTYTHTHIHILLHTHIHTYTHTHIHIRLHTHIHTYTYTYIDSLLHTHIHTYTHAHTHSHTKSLLPYLGVGH